MTLMAKKVIFIQKRMVANQQGPTMKKSLKLVTVLGYIEVIKGLISRRL